MNQLIRDRLGLAECTIEEVTGYLRGFTAGQGSYAAIALGANGEYRDHSGSSDGLSSPLDRIWLKTLRARADVIITTGATVRSEKLLQPSADFLVASKSGDLTGLRASGGRLLVASDVESHPSWPEHAEYFGGFASPVEVVRAAKAHWSNCQLELGAPALTEVKNAGLIDRLFVTAPNESAVRKLYGDCVQLFEFDALAVYSVII